MNTYKTQCEQLNRLQMETPTSCLSPNTHEILCDAAINCDSVASQKFISEDGCILWNFSLPDEQTDRAYFIKCAQLLAPMFVEIEKFYSAISVADFLEKFRSHLEWTTSPEVLLRSFCYLKEDRDGVGLLLCLLMTSSILDRSLGDVFLTCGHKCPSLLKDLLVTPELTQIFDPLKIQFLKILIGPPISLNLRNVVWHGFPSPQELHSRYGYLLLCVIISIGQHVIDKGILNRIKHRQPASLQAANEINFYPFHLNNLSDYKFIIDASTFILPVMKPVWHRAISLFRCNRFGDCVLLLLPQLEHVMRRIYATANGCTERVLTAESNVLFTTFDEILSEMLPNGVPNEVRSSIGDQRMNLLLDLLTYPEGPRIRDRLSHGECDLNTFTKRSASVLLCACLSVCSVGIHDDDFLHENNLLKEITMATVKYDSTFHPLCRLKAEVADVCRSLSRWVSFPSPPDYFRDPNFADVSELKQTLWDLSSDLKLNENLEFDDPFYDLCPLTQRVTDLVLPTLFRHHARDQNARIEAEIVGLLRCIISESSAVSKNVEQILLTRYEQWTKRMLRSRQRSAYLRMIDSLPVIRIGLTSSVMVSVWFLCRFSIPSHSPAQFTRILKQLLQVSENLRSNLSENKNRWMESVQLVLHLTQKLKGLQSIQVQ